MTKADIICMIMINMDIKDENPRPNMRTALPHIPFL